MIFVQNQLLIVKQIQMNTHHSNFEDQGNLLITQLKNGQVLKITVSQYCVRSILEEMVDVSWHRIYQNRFFEKYLPTYSNIRMMNNINEVNSLIFNIFPFLDQIQGHDNEPTPLIIDSLLPISADIDAQNPYKKNNSKKLIYQDSLQRSKISKRESSVDKQREKYTRLHITQISQEDGLTKELRKLEQEKNNKMEIQRKQEQKKNQLKQQKLKQFGKDKKKNQKQQKFSYDYNGEVVQIKMQSKTNLVSKVINGLTNQNTKIVKQVFNDPHPSEVQGNLRKDRKLAMMMLGGKRKDDVQFSQVKSLADSIQTKLGVKYIYGGKTYEEKPKMVNAVELRKTLSQRKISKQDYKRVRDLNGNKNDYQQNLKKSRLKEQKPQRSHSQAKIRQSRQAPRQKEKIHVSNNELKGKLLQKIPQPYNQEQQQQNRQIQTPASRLGNIDNFNLEYLRTGGNQQTNTSKQFYTQRSNNELPKITHTTLYSKMLPKGRERIKDANEIIRDLRKKFQEKLRV